jgi:Cu(I)/Ag(I) efflux system membrane fusion protein
MNMSKNQYRNNQYARPPGQQHKPGQQYQDGLFAPGVGDRVGAFVGKFKVSIQFVLALLVAIVPISFYLSQPSGTRGKGPASSSNFSSIVSSVKEKSQAVFGSKQTANVERSTPHDEPNHGSSRIGDNNNDTQAQAPAESITQVINDNALEHAAKHTNPSYVCPMHPTVINDDPNAICPICGMNLVLLEAGGEAGMVQLSTTVINTLGVRTAKAKIRTLYRRIDSVGYIEVNEGKIRSMALRTEGWIEQLNTKTEGDRIKKGEVLFKIYSPQLVNAQEEYVQAQRHNNQLLINAGREKLLALGVSQDQVDQLHTQEDVKQQVAFYAPQSGVVTKLQVREGMFIKPSQIIMEIVDLDTVWLIAEVFEAQSDWVEQGQRAEATLPYITDKTWEGKVDYIYPSLDASTRSLKVRLQFENTSEVLKPNMYADVRIFAQPKRDVLTVPLEALIVTGNENRVIVALGEGKFVPMSVRVGMQTDKNVEILSGLGEGDEVVTSSQFLIDSESSVKSSLARMVGGG